MGRTKNFNCIQNIYNHFILNYPTSVTENIRIYLFNSNDTCNHEKNIINNLTKEILSSFNIEVLITASSENKDKSINSINDFINSIPIHKSERIIDDVF